MFAVRSWVLATLVLCVAAHGAFAQEKPDFAAAKAHYQAAETAVAEENFAVAAEQYGKAFAITQDAVLFFKIGSAYHKAGDCKTGLIYYRRYINEAKPEPAFVAKTNLLIGECEKQLATEGDGATGTGTGDAADGSNETSTGTGDGTDNTVTDTDSSADSGSGTQAGTDTGPDAALDGQATADTAGLPAALTDEEPAWTRTAAWTSVGVTLALFTTGAVLGLSARSREEDVKNLVDFRDADGNPARYSGATRARYEDLVEEGDRLEQLSVVAFAASGAAAAAAVVFFVMDSKKPASQDDMAVSPTVHQGGAGLSVGWSF